MVRKVPFTKHRTLFIFNSLKPESINTALIFLFFFKPEDIHEKAINRNCGSNLLLLDDYFLPLPEMMGLYR